jgi:hypothetical protein
MITSCPSIWQGYSVHSWGDQVTLWRTALSLFTLWVHYELDRRTWWSLCVVSLFTGVPIVKSVTSLSSTLVRTFWPYLGMSFTPQLGPGVSRVCTRYFYHGVTLGYDFLPPIALFWIIYLKIKYRIFFPLPTSQFVHVSIFLCLDITSVRISSIRECLSP